MVDDGVKLAKRVVIEALVREGGDHRRVVVMRIS